MKFTTAYKIALVMLIVIMVFAMGDMPQWQYHSDADSGMVTRADWSVNQNFTYNYSAINWSEILKVSEEA